MDGINIAEIIQRVVIFMPAFILALVVHEYAHAWMAKRHGDTSSEWAGRLTFNPAAHIDPLGTIVFPMISVVLGSSIFFGWAKPVPIDPRQFKNYRKGLFWVAFAGPISNIILGFLAAFALVATAAYVPQTFSFFTPMLEMLKALLQISFALAIFNLIPLPPLDGSNMLLATLSYEATQKFLVIQQYSFFILIFLMISHTLEIIGVPILWLCNIAINLAAHVFPLSSAL